MPPIEPSVPPAAGHVQAVQQSEPPSPVKPNTPLTGDSAWLSPETEKRIHLAGSVSMIAMTPLMLGMMAMPLMSSSKKSNNSGGMGNMGGMMM
jgi:hypothetical protein